MEEAGGVVRNRGERSPDVSRWSLLLVLSDADRRALLEGARRRQYAKGEVIFHEGDPGGSLHLIERGRVAVRLTTPLGDRAVLRLIGVGGWFGELSAISPDMRSATIVALEPTETYVLPAERTAEMRQRIPDFDRLIVDALVQEVRRLSAALLDALFVPVDKRLFRRLRELAELYGDEASGPAVVPLTQEELAQLVGSTRPTTNKYLRAAAEAGELDVRRGAIEILNSDALAKRAR
jgi:CRP-like cAMP-binding protein